MFDASFRDKDAMKKCRYFAYRQAAYIYSGGQPVGRVQLPQCMVDGIRKVFPDKDGEYVGHKDA